MTTTVQSILRQKGSQTWSVTPDASILQALELMAEKKIGAVLVMEAGQLVGIFSERDYARRGILLRRFDEPPALRFGLPADEPRWARLEAALADCPNLLKEP